MDDIIKILRVMEDFDCLNGASEKEIEAAENDLDLKFAKDYRKYLSEYGLASAAGHEFTGIVKSPRLNVVDATVRIYKKIQDLPTKSYVVEELNIDSIVILQTEDGSIYEAAPRKLSNKIADSLCDYLKEGYRG
jgi:hypothetical protein